MRSHVEYLRTLRDGLLDVLANSRNNVDNLVTEMLEVMPSLTGSAERAGLRISEEPVPSVARLGGEI